LAVELSRVNGIDSAVGQWYHWEYICQWSSRLGTGSTRV